MFRQFLNKRCFHFGLYYLFLPELAIALSGYLNAIVPIDQPGVEAYKKICSLFLVKPGFEELRGET